jgi:hypothetical protein
MVSKPNPPPICDDFGGGFGIGIGVGFSLPNRIQIELLILQAPD